MKEDRHQKPVKLKCEGCGVEAEFNSGDEAFRAGWDCPPMFTGVVTCPKCPSAPILLCKRRAKADE
jgi:peptide subunit release factor 1 (eRF1)